MLDFLIFIFLQQAGIIVVTTKGEKLMVELKDWNKCVQEHFEHDSMGSRSIASNRTIKGSFKQNGFLL